MAVREAPHHILPVFIYAVKEKVFELTLVREGACLLVAHLLDALLLLVEFSLHAQNLVLFIFVKGSEETNNLFADVSWLHTFFEKQALNGWFDVGLLVHYLRFFNTVDHFQVLVGLRID